MTIKAEALTRLRETFAGDVITPEDARYDRARRVWNGMIDRRPAVIVRPTTPAEVATAVKLGRDHDVAIAIRCGGHSLPGLSTCDNGVVIDLSSMRGVSVDPNSRTARANGGALLSELDTAAVAQGLVCPVGVVGHTGVGGLTLGGGMGRLQRRFGLTIDNLLAVELITAQGDHVTASATENPDLFWGMRGAGANFGVVTTFEYRLHPMQPNVTRGSRSYPATRVAEVWQAFRDYASQAPDHIHLALNLSYADPADDYPDPLSGLPIVTVSYASTGDAQRVDEDVAPLLALGPAFVETRVEQSYLELQTSADIEQSWGHRYYNKGGFIDDLPPQALERLIEHVADGAGMGTWGVWTQGGAMSQVSDDATAFTGRHALFDMSGDAKWDQAAQDDERIEWVRAAMGIAEPYASVGRYVNESSDTGDDVTQSIYGSAKLQRLVTLKRAWDPDNVFRMNQNIKP